MFGPTHVRLHRADGRVAAGRWYTLQVLGFVYGGSSSSARGDPAEERMYPGSTGKPTLVLTHIILDLICWKRRSGVSRYLWPIITRQLHLEKAGYTRTVPLVRAALSSRYYGIRIGAGAFQSVGVSVSVGRRQLGSNTTTTVCGVVSCFRTYATAVHKAEVKMPEVKPFERLPTTVLPKHYKLVLTPDLKTFTFKGEVSIEIQVT
ncbi:hypothetical protein FQR65_LT00333 [Abscondita terminalis]|nr:hypothetical protein FQR65_LT00333 [Abscondita terminalis]